MKPRRISTNYYICLVCCIGLLVVSTCRGQVLSETFTIQEETGGHVIGSITIPDGQTYRLSPPNHQFELDGSTGVLRTTGPIDRESLDSNMIGLLAVASSLAPIEITVRVTDINDNDPIFPAPARVDLDIPESTEVGTQYFLPTATDRDETVNAVTSKYHIVEGDTDKFSLLVDSSPGDQTLLYLKTVSGFNREDQVSYLLNISATDDGDPPRNGFLSVAVTILDNNDNEPLFDVSEYSATVYENATVGAEVLVVSATDLDEGDNGLVRYRIGTQSGGGDLFAVDAVTGVVSLKQTLDYESAQTYRLTLEAYDAGDPVLFGRSFVTITVENVNDNNPVIGFSFFPFSASIASVKDQSEPGTLVALVTATDKDSNEQLSLSIVAGNELGHFQLNVNPNLNIGELEVAGPIDRFAVPRYNLTFRAQDRGLPFPRISYKSLDVVVNSDNNNSPVFTSTSYEATLSELAPVGSYVSDVSASDLDVGIPGRLRYRIESGNNLNWFKIDEFNGLITTRTRLRYEMLPDGDEILLIVVAKDETAAPLYSNTTVSIRIVDTNDNPPNFDRDLYETSIRENTSPSNITTVFAADVDSGAGGRVMYSIRSILPARQPLRVMPRFSVGASDGIVSLDTPLTGNVGESYDVVIAASDGGDPILTSTTLVHVTVSAERDVAPTFYPRNYYVSISPGTYANLNIATVTANANGDTVRYSIMSGDNGFAVNAQTGVVTVTSRTFQPSNTFTIQIHAVSSNGMSAVQSATIYVIATNPDISFQFKEPSYEFMVLETKEPLSAIDRLVTTSTGIANPNITYRIAGGDVKGLFSIGSTTGILSLSPNAILDYESNKTFNLTVVATLRGTDNVLSAVASVACVVALRDANDNIPTFVVLPMPSSGNSTRKYVDSATLTLSSSHATVGTIIYNATAVDLDTGLNGRVVYSIQDALNVFSIDSSGIVTVNKPFVPFSDDYVDDVTVTSCDQGSPRMCVYLDLSVTIRPWVGEALVSSESAKSLQVRLYEDTRINTRFISLSNVLPSKFQVPAFVSGDGAILRRVEYEIVAGNSLGMFGVFPDGQVYLARAELDRESTPVHYLGVEMTVSDAKHFYSQNISVAVFVLDVNDNSPTFTHTNRFKFALAEHQKIGTVTGYVNAADIDSGVHASLSYTSNTGYSPAGRIPPLPFTVNRLTGAISTTCNIDREIIRDVWNESIINGTTFAFTITAADNEGVASNTTFSTETTVEIEIVDSNEYAPEFSRSFYRADISEGSESGTFVLQLRATDKDGNANFTFQKAPENEDVPFMVDATTGAISVSPSADLDREIQAVYTFSVQVSDSVELVSMSSIAVVEVRLLDANDSPPVFDNSSLVWDVDEDRRIYEEVGRFRAHDPDQFGPSSIVKFAFAPQTSMSARRKFRIDESSGSVVLTSSLDREATESYELVVTATDSGELVQNTATATASITVNDVNDNAPVFTSPSVYRIPEQTYRNAYRFDSLSATDADAGDSGSVRYAIVRQDPYSPDVQVTVDTETGDLFVSGDVDREKYSPNWKIRVIVKAFDNPDAETERMWTTSMIDLIIDDVNDNAPVFTSPDAVFLPARSTGLIGFEIVTVLAVDQDEGLNGSVSFSLYDSAGPTPFIIQPTTGILELNNIIPDGQSIVFPATVVARDEGMPARFSMMTLSVIVGGHTLNNGPVFQSTTYNGNILENRAVDTSVMTITATGNRVAYFITGVSSTGVSGNLVRRRPFAIDSNTGVVTSLLVLDREDGVTSYTLHVVAVDLTSSKTNPRMSSTQATISILDFNDNPPIFPQTLTEVFISESAHPQYVISALIAADADSTSSITYSLQSGAGSDEFQINPSTGQVSIGPGGLDRERTARYTLTIIADDSLHRSTTDLVVHVIDANDHVPQFPTDNFVFSIEEGPSAPPSMGRYVGSVRATDDDTGINAMLTYSFVNGSDQGRFSIDSQTGSIYLNSSFADGFDRETRDLYVISVRVTDGDGLYSDAIVYLNVADVNDNPPVFNAHPRSVEVPENVDVGHYVTTVMATDADLDFDGIVEYHIVAGDPLKQFKIALDTGVITTEMKLDREKQAVYHFVVMATDLAPPSSRMRSFTNLTVLVTNINDNPPEIIMPNIWHVAENTKPGTAIMRIGAYDIDDLEMNSEFRYNLVHQIPDHSAFTLDSNTGSLLVGSGGLDRENIAQYYLTISVDDQGTPSLSSQRTLEVRIVDENDNSPDFGSKSAGLTAGISESANVGSAVVQATATDADEGYNGLVRYRLVSPPASIPFAIDTNTGSIYLSGKSDYEKASSHVLMVQAYDSGIPSRSADTTLTVQIIDANDCDPVISPASLVVHVEENLTSSDKMPQFDMFDDDTGTGGRVDFRGAMVTSVVKGDVDVSGDTSGLGSIFSLSQSGQLTLNRPLDREEADSYTVVLTAVDRGIPSLTGTASVLVIVDDVNEYTPVFKPKYYRAFVAENAIVGTAVDVLTAHDGDAGKYGTISYTLMSSDDVPFIVDATSGVILTSGSLDRESADEYSFDVVASDVLPGGDEPMRSSTTSVVISITDVNDNHPRFSQDAYAMYTTTAVGICGVVFASDADKGSNGEVTYAIQTSATSLPLRIDENSGVILTTETLISSSYSFQVVASDNGHTSLNITVDVTVSVNPGPYPVYTNRPTSSVDITENVAPSNEVLYQFQATSGRSSTMRYYIVGGNVNDCFVINDSTGELSRVKPLDREAKSSYSLWIEARDSGSPALSAYTFISVNVLDRNDNAPMFSKSLYAGKVREDSSNDVIVTLLAEDPDTSTGGVFEYLLDIAESESPEKFTLDSNTGILRNRLQLNREETESYFLTVLAKDRGSPAMTGTATVHVTVEDINDNRPSFTRLYSASVSEDTEVGGYVTLVTSNDPDTDVNSQNRYSLSDNANGTFNIDPITGLVTIQKKLDRERISSYNLQVNAGDNSWTSHTSITISITDVNDNPPRFLSESYNVKVPTGTSRDTMLINVSSSDDDIGVNQQVWYTIVSLTDYFGINHVTGEIFTTTSLHCSTVPGAANACPLSHTLLVSVTDCGSPEPLSSTTRVNVIVAAPNMHNPTFDPELTFPVAVLQSSSAGTPVIVLRATDEDSGSNISYNVSGTHSSYFSINQTTGEITTARLLSAMPISSKLSFIVRAIDDGVPQRFTDLSVTFEVAGENRNKPAFNRHSYTSRAIPEDSPVGTEVITLNAQDDDAGINGMVLYVLGKDSINKPFKINSTTGSVYTTSSLDYEATSSYTLTVIASDRAVLTLTTQATLDVSISDVNDHSPQFNSSCFVVYSPENIPPQTILTRLSATDKDTSENAVIRYGVYPQDNIVARASTGDIYTASGTHLDYEARNVYQLLVVASSNGRSDLNDTANLTVRVTDQNEFLPEIVSSTFNFVTSVNSLPGKLVTRLNATDEDSGTSGKVLYLLAGWSEGKGFDIDVLTGDIKVTANANLILGETTHLTILAKNPGQSGPSTTLKLNVTVTVITDECMRNPCLNGASCRDRSNDFVCSCTPGYTGRLCGEEINECIPNPCMNGASCDDLVADFRCTCPAGYTGKTCSIDIDYCVGDPCLNGGTCTDGLTTYTCECPFGSTGSNCEVNSLGFEPLSYLALPTLDFTRNSITFEFSTVSSSSLLLYNHGGTDANTFVSIELAQGQLLLSYNFGSSSNNRITTGRNLADGLWHDAIITINQSSASVTIDGCDVSNDATNTCSLSQSHVGLAQNSLAGLGSQALYVGGIPNVTDVLEHPGQVSSFDFVGCLRNLRVNDVSVNSTSSADVLRSVGVTDGCVRTGSGTSGDACSPGQGSSVCGSGATCVDNWSSLLCHCPDDRSGKTCQNTRVGSTFNGVTYLAYTFSPDYIQDQVITSSGALYSASSGRKKRAVDSKDSDLEIQFRTRASDGLLIHVRGTGDTHSSLLVKDGSLVYTYTTASIKKQHTLSTRTDDGQWHRVKVQLFPATSDTSINITLDDVPIVQSSFIGGITDFTDTQQVKAIYIGGAPLDATNTSPALDGCVYSFHLNGQLQPLADDGGSSSLVVTQAGSSTGGAGVVQGCTGRNVCASNPCASLSLFCNDVWEAHECIPFGECSEPPCLNGGSCVPFTNGTFQCVCASNYTGQICADFIPCLQLNCDSQGPNRVCVASNNQATCVCAADYTEDNGACVASQIGGSPGPAWWVYVVAVIGFIVIVAGIVFLIRRHLANSKNKKDTPRPQGLYNQRQSPTKSSNGNGQIGRSNESYEFDKIATVNSNNNGHIPQTRPDLLSEDVRIVDEEAVNYEEQTSSGIGSTRSTTSSPLKELSPMNGTVSPLHEGKDYLFNNGITFKSSSPLPSYDLIMRERTGCIPDMKSSSRNASTLPAMYESERESSTDVYSTPTIPRDFFKISSTPTSVARSGSSAKPPSSFGSHSQADRSRTRSPFGRNVSVAGSHSSHGTESTGHSTHSFITKPPFLPNGRMSPTKVPTPLPRALDRTTPQISFTPNMHTGYRTPSSTYSRRVSGSAASSSTASSSSHEHVNSDTPRNVTTIEDMVQHLNGLVGLTNEEIELLNENPKISHSYSSSNASESTVSYPSSFLPEDKHFKPFTAHAHNDPTNRPSSLPGRRINRVSVSNRSRTPMLLPPTSPYKPTTGLFRNKYPDIPPDLRPSEFLQPPPDTSSDEDEYVFEKSATKHEPNLPLANSETGIAKDSNGTRPEDEIQLDFLMSYGKHYEALVGVFEDLAALPTIADENEEIETRSPSAFPANSYVIKSRSPDRSRTVSHSSSEHSGNRRPPSRVQRKTSASRDSMSPAHSSTSSRSHSVNRKRQEHYV